MSTGPSPREFVRLQLTQATLDSLVYGIYVVLFGMSAHVMRRSFIKRTSYDFFALIALFIVATIVFLCDLFGTAGSFYNNFKLGGISASMNALEARKFDHGMISATQTGYAIANILADFILLRRCYIVWSRSKCVIWFPILISCLGNALGLATVPILFLLSVGTLEVSELLKLSIWANNMLTAFMAVSAFTNVLLSLLIAGKIFSILRQVDQWGGSDSRAAVKAKKQYMYAIALILESGLIYPVTVIVFEIVTHTVSVTPSLYPLMTFTAGIAPTLILIRVQLGISVNNVDETLGSISFRFASEQSGSRMNVTQIATNAVDDGKSGTVVPSAGWKM